MILIRPIHADEVPAAKRVLLEVAHRIFGGDKTLEENIELFEPALSDMDEFQIEYLQQDGLFLVVLDDQTVIGSGAIRRLEAGTAEVKRMWLLEDYHGQGIGFQVFQQLLDFARSNGYKKVRLQTSPEQTKALDFYRRVGFIEIPCYNDDTSEVSMELMLDGAKEGPPAL
jgi:putative acetyltransferase